MDEDLEKFIAERCDFELQKNHEYVDLQNDLACAHENNDIESFSKISFQMQCVAMRNSYKLAIKDVYNVIHE
jgi:hypothetical protein